MLRLRKCLTFPVLSTSVQSSYTLTTMIPSSMTTTGVCGGQGKQTRQPNGPTASGESFCTIPNFLPVYIPAAKALKKIPSKKDLDASLDADKEYSSDYPALDIFRSLYENGSFRKELIVTLCDLRNYNYEKKRAGKAIDNLAVSYKKLADDSFYRYGPDWVVMYDGPTVYYDTKIKEFKQYMNGRYMAFPNLMKKTFSLKDPCTIKITVSDPEYGDVLLNRTDIDFSNLPNAEFTGDYFEEYEITLTAAPKEGHTFVKWIVGGDEFTDDTITLTPYDKCTIEVQYK